MFFLLSKTLDILLSPAVWIFFLLLLALAVRSGRTRKRLAGTALLVFWIFSNPYLTGLVWRLYEAKPVPIKTLPRHDVAIVLGGFTNLSMEPHDRVYLSEAVDRLMHPLYLWRQGKVGSLIITGGSGLTDSSTFVTTEAASVYQVEQTCVGKAIPTWLEDKSRNTRENALNSRPLIDSLVAAGQLPRNPRILLVTSGFHMRRAKGCYDRVGMAVTPFPVDFRLPEGGHNMAHVLVPSADALRKWEILLREIFGLLVYKAMGYC